MDWLKVLQWNDDYLEDLRHTTYYYLREGHYHIAQVFCEALCLLCPENAYDLRTLGALYLELGNPVKGLNYLEKSLKKEPGHFIAQLNRIKALLMLGYREESLRLLKGFVATCHETPIQNEAMALWMAYNEEKYENNKALQRQ